MYQSRQENEMLDSSEVSLEDAIFSAGDKLSDAAYEKYTSGRITQEQMKDVFKRLSEWSAKSEELLKALA